MTTPQLSVHFLPDQIRPEQLAPCVAVVIDVLRASTTITTALCQGASAVIPCLSVEEAQSLRLEPHPEQLLLGGERGGRRIDGFDCGNSPAEYDSSTVRGRRIGFTTTNGTRALLKCLAAHRIIVGSFVNLSSIVQFLRQEKRPVHLVCAGTDGDVTGEDVLFAGAVISRLVENGTGMHAAQPMTGDLHSGTVRESESAAIQWLVEDSARIALAFWNQEVGHSNDSPSADPASSAESAAGSLPQLLESALRRTRGGRNLIQLGYDRDIRLCSRIDDSPVVPEFLPHRERTAATGAAAGVLLAAPAIPRSV